MSLRLFLLICLALLVVVYAPLPASAAPHELNESALDKDVAPTPAPTGSDGEAKPQQRTFFLLLPLLFPDQFYFA
ncbi:uncharacterized protein LOC117793026 [Drosophila innubila]|uniref:uncharacterized protein LOC117793026 n=1 Tax=Drosophila innubila TaxID=198719 RepID=UPI00148E4305|nr:uncharacterized protein LOC117793026 [Drosophila innubila]